MFGSHRTAQAFAALVALLCATVLPDALRAPARSESAAGDDRRPNVLIIVSDDQRFGTLKWMPRTRHSFTRRGRSFTNAFAVTPLCCPSRASIMTGMYPHNHNVRKNGQGRRLDQSATIQGYLHRAGYKTAMAGKFLNGWRPREAPPYFDRWSMFSPPGRFSGAQQETRNDGYYDALFNNDGHMAHVREYSTEHVSDQGIGYVREFETQDDRPWFLMLAPYSAHPPYTPKPAHRGMQVGSARAIPSRPELDRSDKPPWVIDKTKHRKGAEIRRRQLRNLRGLDDMVDDVFTSLRSLGELDETLAIYLSDNGYMWGEHGILKKRFPYTESVRIPFLVRWPGHVSEASTDARLVATVDVLPTVLEAVGLDPHASHIVDGRSIFETGRRKSLLLEYFKEKGVPDWASLRTRSYHYIEYYRRNGKTRFKEYYDLDEDPWQLQNLFATGRGPRIERLLLERELESARTCEGKDCP